MLRSRIFCVACLLTTPGHCLSNILLDQDYPPMGCLSSCGIFPVYFQLSLSCPSVSIIFNYLKYAISTLFSKFLIYTLVYEAEYQCTQILWSSLVIFLRQYFGSKFARLTWTIKTQIYIKEDLHESYNSKRTLTTSLYSMYTFLFYFPLFVI